MVPKAGASAGTRPRLAVSASPFFCAGGSRSPPGKLLLSGALREKKYHTAPAATTTASSPASTISVRPLRSVCLRMVRKPPFELTRAVCGELCQRLATQSVLAAAGDRQRGTEAGPQDR